MTEETETEIKAYLQEGGSATRATFPDVIDAENTEVTRSFGKPVTSGEIETHPEIDGASRLAEGS